MVWYFIGVYIIKRTLHGRLEIRNFSSRVEKIFHSFAALTREIFFNTRTEISYLARPCNILYIYNAICFYFIHTIQQLYTCITLFDSLEESSFRNPIRHPIILKTKFGGNFVTSFSRQICQNLKNIKTNVFWNCELYCCKISSELP